MIPTSNEMQPTKEAPDMEMPDAEPAAVTDTVPIDALAMPDDKEQMTPPEVGDEVNYSVTGKVTAINGGMATIERTAINGNDIGDHDGDEETESSLQSQAQQLDQTQT